jgi:hypothetical protein
VDPTAEDGPTEARNRGRPSLRAALLVPLILLAACNTNGVRTVHNRTTVPIVFSSIQDQTYVPACTTVRFRWGPTDWTKPHGGPTAYLPLDSLPALAADQVPVLVELPIGGPDSYMDEEAVVTAEGSKNFSYLDDPNSIKCQGVPPDAGASPSP